MNTSTDAMIPQQITLTLEITPTDAQYPDFALIGVVGRDLSDQIRHQGHKVQPVYTEQRGGNFLVDIILWIGPFLEQVWTQKEIILADGSALVTILGAAVGLRRYLQS